jgi:hypothetical protein
MPFKSKAQRRKFAELLVNGKITDEAYERWNRDTGREELPERVTPKDKRAAKRKGRSTTKRRASRRTRATTRNRATTRKRTTSKPTARRKRSRSR